MKKGIGDQMQCKKEEMWKRVCEAWYNVTPINNLIPRRIADLIKAKGDATKY